MADPVSGLAIARIQHLPVVLQNALRRGQPESAEPLIFFAEMLKKVSQYHQRKREKDRLCVVTKDTLFLFTADGHVKRKVRLVDIDGFAFEDAPDAHGYLAVGLMVPSTYDIALETNRRPAEVSSLLLRVIGTLRGIESRDTVSVPSLNVRVMRNPGDAPFHSLFRLKKAKGSRQPIIPPVLETISDELQKRRSEDHKLALEETINGLLTELHKYADECWAARGAVYSSVTSQLADVIDERERISIRIDAERQLRLELEADNAARGRVIRAALDEAQHAHSDEVAAINEIRAKHTDALGATRANIAAAEERATDYKVKTVDSYERNKTIQRDLEDKLRLVTKHAAALQTELEACMMLPSRSDLNDERDALDGVRLRVEHTLNMLNHQREDETALVELHQQLCDENDELKRQVLDAKEGVRDLHTDRQRAAVELSMAAARRTRSDEELERLSTSAAAIDDEMAAFVAAADELADEVSGLEHRRQLLELEKVVCEDLKREAEIHESIATSVRRMMKATEVEAAATEERLQAEYEELESQRRTRHVDPA